MVGSHLCAVFASTLCRHFAASSTFLLLLLLLFFFSVVCVCFFFFLLNYCGLLFYALANLFLFKFACGNMFIL